MTETENPTESPIVAATGRPHPARLSRALYPVIAPVTLRYGDVDVNRHINNLALEALHENARAEFNDRVVPSAYRPGAQTIRLVVASHVVHFLAEVHWPGTLDTALGVGRIGRTSFVLSTALFAGDTCASLCDSVLVTLGPEQGQGPTPIPDDVRDRLGTHLLRG